MKKYLLLCMAALLALFALAGCGREAATGVGGQISLTDDNGRQVNLTKPPERIVVLSPSFLELLEAVDGKVVGRAKSTIAKTPAFAAQADEVGFIFNINIEKVVELKPDLVIAYQGMHEKFLPLLAANKIPTLVLSLKTYDDVKHALQILGKATGHEEQGIQIAAELDRQIQATAAALPKQNERVAILHSSAQNVTLEQESSIAGCAAKLLHLQNIVQKSAAMSAPTGEQMSDQAPYSLEYLVEQDPEVIFITSMGAKADIQARLDRDVMSSPAWRTITAVKNHRVYYLPDELFLLNPGLRYPEAVRLMADKLAGR